MDEGEVGATGSPSFGNRPASATMRLKAPAMIRYKKPVVFPDSLEFRFVVGRLLMFLPVFCGMAVLFWAFKPSLFLLFAGKYIFILALIAWWAVRKAESERMSIENWARRDARFTATINRLERRTDLLCLCGALASVAITYPLMHGDLRRIVVVVWLAILLLGGWLLRWLVWDRWLQSELRRLYTEVRFSQYD